MSQNWERILIHWLANLEGGKGELPFPKEKKREAYGILLQTLKDSGFDRDFAESKVNIIIGHSIGPSKKRKEWEVICRKQLNLAFGDVWKDDVELSDAPTINVKETTPKVTDKKEAKQTENTKPVAEECPPVGIPLEDSEIKFHEGIEYDLELRKQLGFSDE